MDSLCPHPMPTLGVEMLHNSDNRGRTAGTPRMRQIESSSQNQALFENRFVAHLKPDRDAISGQVLL